MQQRPLKVLLGKSQELQLFSRMLSQMIREIYAGATDWED